MAKTILLVHGRHYKPPKDDLEELWFKALRYGIEQDHPEKLQAFDDATVELVYYGDISEAVLRANSVEKPKEADDLQDRWTTLNELKEHDRADFTQTVYESLPGYNPWKEGLADTLAGVLNWIGLSQPIIERVAPDMAEYWRTYRFGRDIRAVFTDSLVNAMNEPEDEICVIAHSLGSMVSYDVFWKLSHSSEYRALRNREISLWITIGSPLADETVKGNLKGAAYTQADRYPTNVVNWLNIAAEDDFISHDQNVANDFEAMTEFGYVKSITDKRIYNIAVRGGKSNPHHDVGYLIHPTMADAVANWL